MASVSRLPDIAAPAREAGWAPRPAAVAPAVQRMHERLRASRTPGERGALPVPSVAPRAFEGFSEADGKAEALAALDGGTAAIERSPLADVAPARFAETVERFVRLRGRSGRSYVFSRIEPRHVSLYRNGVFATAPRGAERARVIGDVAPILSNAVAADRLYVHLLSETDGDRAAVVADLS